MRRLALILVAAALVALGGCTEADSVEKGCKTAADCPRPDRQICQVETGVCVGFTSPPGQVDGGDDEGVDASADAG
jgi:hypothetical protein